jgi:hypothetical protein
LCAATLCHDGDDDRSQQTPIARALNVVGGVNKTTMAPERFNEIKEQTSSRKAASSNF